MMSVLPIISTLLILVGILHGKPFSEDDLDDFEIAISKSNEAASDGDLIEESKRVRAVIKEENRKLKEKREAGLGTNHHKAVRINSYGPEIINRNKGPSLTETIEKANQGIRDKLIYGDILRLDKSDNKRVVTTDARKKWPGGIVPYLFDTAFPSDFETVVRQAFATLERVTCLKFKPKTSSDQNAIKIIKSKGCYSYVGVVGGIQDVSIGKGCEYEDTIIHELLHAVGFWHEQNRPDRDQFIRVRMENVEKGMEHNFDKRTTSESATYQPYDLKSIMHYGNTDFTGNGKNTMESIANPSMPLGQPIGEGTLTNEDVYEIIQAYCVAAKINGAWSEWSAWSTCSVSCKAGARTQTRKCSMPAPQNGGQDCSGDTTKTEACNMGDCELGKGVSTKCSFEVNMCNWKSGGSNYDAKYSLIFRRNQGSTPSVETGPSVDATSGLSSGHYVYMETSQPTPSTALSSLESPVFPAIGANSLRCLSYNVHMYGETMGELTVLSINLETNAETILRSHKGNHKDNWYYNEVAFDGSHANKIMFEGKRREASWQSDIALDDIQVTETDCLSGFHDCDFEASICEWRMESANSYFYPLVLNSGPSPNAEITGPEASSNGKGYIFTDGTINYAWENDQSSLFSPLIAQSDAGSICLTFDYFMDLNKKESPTNYMGTLAVHAKDTSGTVTDIWENSDNKGIRWIKQKLTIASKDTLELQFRFVKGSAENGDIGLDNVKVRDGAC